ncbi:MAG: hypothetical protein K2J78_01900 [Muribaculaceae bacterium]|nr:hypothetical protein [Muribaculaceae bacterium]MDE6768459.1 hypothetical protein [Muribaculaceae bacterium]
MIKESLTYSNEQLHQLIDSYFEGSIPPAQLEMLLDVSKAYGNGDLPIGDEQLAEELLSISAIENYAQAALVSLEAKVPADLESRLDSHISQLASRSRRKWIWVKAGSAAACVALLLTAGLHFMNHTSTLPTLKPENRINIASAVQPSNETDSGVTKTAEVAVVTSSELMAAAYSDEPTSSGSVASAIAPPTLASVSGVVNTNRKRSLKVSNEKNRAKTLGGSTTINLPHPLPETTIPDIAGSIDMPETLPHIQGVMPTLLAAKSEVADLITSPFTAIGQTFDKVVESLNVVNATMYEANKTAAAVSQEFLEASTAPLRSI